MERDPPVEAESLLADYRRFEAFLRAFREECARGGSRAPEHLRDALQAQERLLSRPELVGSGDVEDALADEFDSFEQEALALFSDTLIDAEEAGRRLTAMRCSARSMRRVARVVSGHPRRDEVPFLLAELRDVENGLVFKDTDEDDTTGSVDLDEELAETRIGILRAHVERLLHRTGRVTFENADDTRRAFGLARALDTTRFRLGEDSDELDDDARQSVELLGRSVDKERVRLLDRSYSFLDGLGPSARIELFEDLTPALVDEIEEARVSSSETVLARDISRLERLEEKALRFVEHFDLAVESLENDEGARASSPTVRAARRRVRVQLRRLQRLRTDHMMSLRLQRMFGRRTVRRWETLVFWMILGVLGLLVIDHYRSPDPPGVFGWTVWADTVICVFLLLDYLTRCALHPHSIRYFFRHSLTDLLPSLPIAMLVQTNNVRLVRALRLIRVVRVLRIMRPLRLFLFFARAMDRLVERNAWLLNRNLVFLSDDSDTEVASPALKRAQELDLWVARSSSRALARLDRTARTRTAGFRAALVRVETAHIHPELEVEVDTSGLRNAATRNLDVEDAVRFLRDLDDGQVAETIGAPFARDVTSSLRVFRLPMIRRLPIVRFVIGSHGNPDPLLTTARLGNVLGDLLAQIQRVLQWFADLHGTITGAQFLDRVGLQLVRATARPAKRLLLFGLGLGLLLLLVSALRLSFVDPIVTILEEFLALPVLVLGIACLVPLALGTWFRRIAGRVADLYDRVAEGQFISLSETVKAHHRTRHLETLARRVLLPEQRLARPAAEEGDEERELDEERACLARIREEYEEAETGSRSAIPEERSVDWPLRDRMFLFYREFADGSALHASDTKVASLLIGNLTLENVRINRLHWTNKQLKHLQRLDLTAGRGLATGPGLWFRFITRTVAHHVARLVLEYNQHCLPLSDLDAAPERDRRIYDAWRTRRDALSKARVEGGSIPARPDLTARGTGGTLTYFTTEFHALHFMTVDERRDQAVAERFGERVLALLREDRRQMVREVFSTFPMNDIPPEHRVLNPYEFYRRFCAKGRFVFLPFALAWIVFRGLGLISRRVMAIVGDVIRPHDRPMKVNEGHCGFHVARRKIHRMRRPVVMECLRLRAHFDVESFGLGLPGRTSTLNDTLADDLLRVNASQHEWEEFRDLKADQERRLRLLGRMIEAVADVRGAEGETLEERLVSLRPSLEGRTGPALRAMSLAFACDHERLFSLAAAHDTVAEFLQRLSPRPPRSRLPPLWPRRALRIGMRHWTVIAGAQADDDDLHRVFKRALVEHARTILAPLETLDRLRGRVTDVPGHVVDRLLDEAERPSAWSEQIVAIRTVQALAMLDLEGYEELVAELGEFDRSGTERRAPGSTQRL